MQKLTVELNIAVRLAEGVLGYAFVTAVVGHRYRTYHELHVHLVRVVREGWLIFVPCNYKILIAGDFTYLTYLFIKLVPASFLARI